MTIWKIPTPGGNAFGIAISPAVISEEGVFFTEPNANTVDRLVPATNTLTEWTLPQPNCVPFEVFAGEFSADEKLWVAELGCGINSANGKIALLERPG